MQHRAWPLRARALAPALVTMLAAAAALAPGVRADEPALADHWMDASAARIGLHKILIVGISKDAKARRKFEDRFVAGLRAHNTEGVTGYSIVPDLQADRDRDEVLAELFAQHVDGVIIVRIKPVDETSEAAWAAGWRAAQEQPQRARAYVEASLKENDPEASDFGVEVSLWSLGSAEPGRRIWAGRFPRQSITYLRKHAGEMVQTIINEMQYKDLF